MKTYRALLTQSGTDDPQVNILENDLGSVIWSRTFTGQYSATLSGAFPDVSKVGLSSGSLINNAFVPWATFAWTSNDTVVLTTYDGDSQSDELLYNTFVQILVYP